MRKRIIHFDNFQAFENHCWHEISDENMVFYLKIDATFHEQMTADKKKKLCSVWHVRDLGNFYRKAIWQSSTKFEVKEPTALTIQSWLIILEDHGNNGLDVTLS